MHGFTYSSRHRGGTSLYRTSACLLFLKTESKHFHVFKMKKLVKARSTYQPGRNNIFDVIYCISRIQIVGSAQENKCYGINYSITSVEFQLFVKFYLNIN